jgi:hypothetical protein
MAAEMTGKAVICAMQGKGEATIRTAADMPALLAEQGSRVTTPVQEKDGLLTGLKPLGHRHL